jgi:hypothetical protein
MSGPVFALHGELACESWFTNRSESRGDPRPALKGNSRMVTPRWPAMLASLGSQTCQPAALRRPSIWALACCSDWAISGGDCPFAQRVRGIVAFRDITDKPGNSLARRLIYTWLRVPASLRASTAPAK